MGKFNSEVKQIESRTASWNGLCSTFEGPLYFLFSLKTPAYAPLPSSQQGPNRES